MYVELINERSEMKQQKSSYFIWLNFVSDLIYLTCSDKGRFRWERILCSNEEEEL